MSALQILATAQRPSGFDSAPAPALTISIIPSDRGTIHGLRAADGRTENAMVTIPEIGKVDGAIAVNNALPVALKKFEANSARFIGQELDRQNILDAKAILYEPVRGYLANARKMKVDILAELAKLAAVPINESFTEAQIRSQIRDMLRGSTVGEQAQIIDNADFRTLCAICEAPATVSGLHPDVYQVAVDRLTFANVARIAGTAANHANKPTLDSPIAHGIDQQAVEVEAKAILENRKVKIEAADAAGINVVRICQMIALACSLPIEEIFNAIAGS